jgi:hypothetical protein
MYFFSLFGTSRVSTCMGHFKALSRIPIGNVKIFNSMFEVLNNIIVDPNLAKKA